MQTGHEAPAISHDSDIILTYTTSKTVFAGRFSHIPCSILSVCAKETSLVFSLTRWNPGNRFTPHGCSAWNQQHRGQSNLSERRKIYLTRRLHAKCSGLHTALMFSLILTVTIHQRGAWQRRSLCGIIKDLQRISSHGSKSIWWLVD